jgi:RNA-directed DNA polymerase
MGKGVATLCSQQNKHRPDKKIWDKPVQTSLLEISKRAETHPKHRFGNLSGLLTLDHLRESYYSLKKKASAGVDGVDWKAFGVDLESNLENLWSSVKKGSYKAKLVKRKYIPKGGGKTRPLGIPAIGDKVLQQCVRNILESIFEVDFPDCSFGYRKGLGPHDALKYLNKGISFGKVGYVVEADIKGFFNNIDHDWMIKMLEERIDDRPFIGIIRKWLKAGILEEDGKVISPVSGTPQGGVASPVLANIYLHYVLDLWFKHKVAHRCKGEAFLCRYADDFVAVFQYKNEAEAFYEELGGRLGKFNLEVAPEKTKMIRFSRFQQEESGIFEFLGFQFYWGKSRKGRDSLKMITSPKKMRGSLHAMSEWLMKNRHMKTRELIKLVNAKLRGYWGYYGRIGNYERLAEYFHIAKRLMFRALNNRSQRRSYSWNGFHMMLNSIYIEKPRITENNQFESMLVFT